jgi:hypothetical protein
MGLISLGSGIISGLIGTADSPQEEEVRKILDNLYSNMSWLKETPFSKEELFNTVMKSIQQTYRGAADVVAGKVGSTLPETGAGVPQGQAFMDYYIQNLAPIIGQGEKAAGDVYQNFVQLWGQFDAEAKNRFLNANQLAIGAAGGLPDQTGMQRFFTNFLSGANIGATVTGNINMAGALADKAGSMDDLISSIFKSQIGEIGQDFLKTREGNNPYGATNPREGK